MGKDGGERVWGWGEGLNVNVGRLLKRSRDHRQAAQEIEGSQAGCSRDRGIIRQAAQEIGGSQADCRDHRLIAGITG